MHKVKVKPNVYKSIRLLYFFFFLLTWPHNEQTLGSWMVFFVKTAVINKSCPLIDWQKGGLVVTLINIDNENRHLSWICIPINHLKTCQIYMLILFFLIKNSQLSLESSNIFYPLKQNKKGGKYCRKIPASYSCAL